MPTTSNPSNNSNPFPPLDPVTVLKSLASTSAAMVRYMETDNDRTDAMILFLTDKSERTAKKLRQFLSPQ
jgi:hypothetical protein